ncbi:MAG: hypothetical protein Q9168_004296 [Polycauliona sp. 1 TL-2023]
MDPATLQHQISPRPNVFIPIEARREGPRLREHHQAPTVNGHSHAQSNGALASKRPRRPKLLSVDEALQYSPFSSIVPFTTGPLFPSIVDRRAARESLELLDADISRTNGNSAMSKHALDVIKGHLEKGDLTEL